MISLNEKFIIVTLLVSLFVISMSAYGIYKRNKQLKVLSDEKMSREVLRNFSVWKFRIKMLLCGIIPLMYVLILWGIMGENNFMREVGLNRNLTKVLMLILVIEQLIPLRKCHISKTRPKG
jgi:hypothetical protein